MAKSEVTVADINLAVDGSGFERAMNNLLLQIETVEKKLQGISNKTTAAVNVEIRKEIKELQKLLGQLNSVERNANNKGFGNNEQLKYRRELNALEAKSYTDAAAAGRARLGTENQLGILHQRFAAAAVTERKGLRETIKTEELRLQAIKAQEQAITRLTRAREREARAGQGPGSSILPAGGFGTVVARTASYGAAGVGLGALTGAVAAAATNSIELEEKLAKLGAISGSTGSQMAALSENIFQVAQNSSFATSELIDASTQLAQAGFSAGAIGENLQAASNLAVASGSTITQSVDTITSAIGAFQLQQSEGVNIANSLTAALNKSKLTIEQVGLAVQYAGQTSFEQNISFQELVATAGTLAQVGIRSGSTQGTGLRQLLVDLQTPTAELTRLLKAVGLTAKDVDVTTLGFVPVLQTLANSGFDSAAAFASMETRAAATYLALKNNIPVLQELRIAQAQGAAATEAAGVAMDTFAAQWQRFKNNLGEDSSNLFKPIIDGTKSVLKMSNDISEFRKSDYVVAARKAAIADAEAAEAQRAWWDGNNRGREVLDNYNEKMLEVYETTRGYTAATEESRTAMEEAQGRANKLTDEFSQQESTVEALTQATELVTLKQKSLNKNSAELQVETYELMGRFKGLAGEIDMTSLSAGGLVRALQNVTAAAREALISTNQAIQAENRIVIAESETADRTNKDNIRGSSFYKSLSTADKELIEKALTNTFRSQNTTILGDFAKSAGKSDPAAARLLNQTVINSSKGYAAASDNKFLAINQGILAAAKSPEGRELEAAVTRLKGQTRKAILAELEIMYDVLNKSKDVGFQQFLGSEIQRATGFLPSEIPDKTKKEKKPGRDGATATRNSIYDVQREVERMGGTIGERVGETKYKHKGAGHKESRAFDVSFQGGEDTDPKVIAKQNALAEKYQKQGFTILWNKKRYGSDGKMSKIEAGANQHTDHMHIEEPKGGAFSKNNAETNALKDEQELILKNAKIIAKRKVSNTKNEMKDTIENLSNSLSEETFAVNKTLAEEAFKATESAIREQGALEIAKMSVEEAADLQIEIEENVAQLRDEFAEDVSKSLTTFVQSIMDSAARATQQALEAAQNNITVAEARVAGLDRMAAKGGFVPEYVRSSAENKITEAKEAYAVQRTQSLPAEIAEGERAMAISQNALDQGSFSKDQIKARTEAISEMMSSVLALKAELSGLEISAAAATQIPTSISGNISLAVSEWERLRGAQKTWAETIGSEVGPALDFLEGGLNDMFNNMANGSRTVLQSFGDMAKGIIKYIQQLVIKIIASKIIMLLAQIVGSAMGGGPMVDPGGGGYSGAGSWTDGFFNGGSVKGYSNGGRVANGARGYDSVNAVLAKDEFVVRSAAVKSVGVDFMNDLNNNGAKAMKGMQSLAVLPTQGKQETNVYVVKQDAAPTMGPNDVLAVISEDILRDGTTKRLIKHVAQGG